MGSPGPPRAAWEPSPSSPPGPRRAAWATPVADAEPQLTVLGLRRGHGRRDERHRQLPRERPAPGADDGAGVRSRDAPGGQPARGGTRALPAGRPALVVWERLDPYVFTNIPPGEHVLLVELVQNDHGPLSTPVAQTIRFRTTGLLATSGAGAGREALQAGALALGAGVALAGAGFLAARQASARRRRW